MRALSVPAALLIGAGLAGAATAGLGYLTRYSMFDAMYGEIDAALYLRITAMTFFEKAAILGGIAAVLLGLAIAVTRVVGARRGRQPDS